MPSSEPFACTENAANAWRRFYDWRRGSLRAGNKVLLNRLAEKPSGGRAWECDHKIAVYEGGGMCTVDNAQTLCVVCHAAKTKAQAKSRAAKRRRDAEATQSTHRPAHRFLRFGRRRQRHHRRRRRARVPIDEETARHRSTDDDGAESVIGFEEDDGAEDDDIRPVFSSVQRVRA